MVAEAILHAIRTIIDGLGDIAKGILDLSHRESLPFVLVIFLILVLYLGADQMGLISLNAILIGEGTDYLYEDTRPVPAGTIAKAADYARELAFATPRGPDWFFEEASCRDLLKERFGHYAWREGYR